MRKISFLFMLSLFLLPAGLPEVHPSYRCMAINLIGPSNRFFPTIIVSDTAEGAEWYRHKLFHNAVFDFASVYIVPRPALAGISEKISIANVQDYKEKAMQPVETKVLAVTICNGEHFVQLKLGKRVSRELILEFDERFPKDTALRLEMEDLQHMLGPE